MLQTVAERTQTVQIARASDGEVATQNLSSAIDRAVERHLPEWRQNLISAWQQLSPSELEQVCTALNRRDQQTYMQFATRVGRDVQRRNEPLLNRAGAQVLEELFGGVR